MPGGSFDPAEFPAKQAAGWDYEPERSGDGAAGESKRSEDGLPSLP
jgi:hypothetical protein